MTGALAEVPGMFVPCTFRSRGAVPIKNRVTGMLQSRHWLYAHGSTELGGERSFTEVHRGYGAIPSVSRADRSPRPDTYICGR
jgi:hypothetical protein